MFRQLRKHSFLMKVLEQRSGKNRTETVIPAIYNLTFISQPSSAFEKWTSRLIRLREIKQVHESHRQAMNKSRKRIWSFRSHSSTLSIQPKKLINLQVPTKQMTTGGKSLWTLFIMHVKQSSLLLNWTETQNGLAFARISQTCVYSSCAVSHILPLSACLDIECLCNSLPSEKFWCLQPVNSSC